MILGYSTNAFVKFSLYEAFEKIAALGFRGVEIMCDRPHLYPPDFSSKALTKVKAAIEKQHLQVTNLNSFTLFAVGNEYLPSWIEPDQEKREIRIHHTLECLKIAHALGCSNISVPPGGPPGEMPPQQALSLFHGGLDKVIPLAESLNVRILVEPEPGLLMENSRQFKSFIRDISSAHVGLNFDIGHFFCAGENPGDAFEELFQWIGHVHLEDIAANRVHRHLITGQGAIPFADLFRTMARLGYSGHISLELYPYVDAPEEAGRKSLAHILPVFREAGLKIEK